MQNRTAGDWANKLMESVELDEGKGPKSKAIEDMIDGMELKAQLVKKLKAATAKDASSSWAHKLDKNDPLEIAQYIDNLAKRFDIKV